MYRETTVEWMKLRVESTIWKIRKQKTTNQNNKEKKEPPPNEDNISSLWDNLKCCNIHIIGVPEGKEQKIGNLLKKIMKKKTSLIW